MLYETLSCDKTTPFCSSNTLYYSSPSFPRCGRRQYTVRCAPSFHGTSSFEWLMYRVKDAVLRDGQAMVVENTRARGWQRLVAKRADQSVSPTGCVLTKYGFKRLQCDVAEGSAACMDVKRSDDVKGWLAVEYD